MSACVRWWAAALATVFLIESGHADVPNQASYEKVFSGALARINAALGVQHLPALPYNPQQLTFSLSSDQTWRTNVMEVASSSDVHLQILPDSMEIVSFQRNFPPEEYINYDTPPKPKWQADQAINQAKEWVKSVLGHVPENTGKPKAEYAPEMNLPKYHEGTWTVSWPRTDSEGHLFANDVVNVILSEKFGLIAMSCIFTSKYAEGQKVLVSRDQAIDIGRPAAQKLLGGPLTADWSAGLSLRPTATASLWIVNPNHLLQYKSLDDMATTTGDGTARLAWVAEYRAENANGMGRYVDVWVDAQTKAILGGDFHN